MHIKTVHILHGTYLAIAEYQIFRQNVQGCFSARGLWYETLPNTIS